MFRYGLVDWWYSNDNMKNILIAFLGPWINHDITMLDEKLRNYSAVEKRKNG